MPRLVRAPGGVPRHGLGRLGPRRRAGRQLPGRAARDAASIPAPKRGPHPGPNPPDRGTSGPTRPVVVDRHGIPLAKLISAANGHDARVLEELLDAIPPIKRRWGRPRKRPAQLHADQADDFDRCRPACRRRGIQQRIARWGIDSREKLGRHRWVVERTLVWLARFRRLAIRSERRADIHLGFLTLGCARICWNFLQHQ
jgi:IS5 family transposase